jgi:predicted double-glycine peptidase
MTYYEKLVQRMDKSMQAHPRSTIAMDANTFEVLATGTDTARLAQRLKKLHHPNVVVFQRPNPNHIMVL